VVSTIGDVAGLTAGVVAGVSSLMHPTSIAVVAIATIAIKATIFLLSIFTIYDMQVYATRYKKVYGFYRDRKALVRAKQIILRE
jgi:hypothetical protein